MTSSDQFDQRQSPGRRSAARRLSAMGTVLAVVVAALLAGVGPASAGSGEGDFVSRMNSARAAVGLRSLSSSGDLTGVARAQSARMAAAGRIYHNPSLGSAVRGWQTVGENVGSGGSVSSLHAAFMASAGHRANILSSRFTQVGVGTVTAGGVIYVTVVFRQPFGSSSASPTPGPTPPRSASAQQRSSSSRATPTRPASGRPASGRPASEPQSAPVVSRPSPAAVLMQRLLRARAAATSKPAATDPLARAAGYVSVLDTLTR